MLRSRRWYAVGALALGQPPPAYDGRCPFRGLQPFRAEDRDFFFGREKLVEELCDKVAAGSFLGVLAASGSGKVSSRSHSSGARSLVSM